MEHPTPRPTTGARSAVVAVVALGSLAMLPACTGPKGVPSGSSLVTEATVKSSFQAPTDGMLWIFRTPSRGSRGQLHYSGPMGAGQVLVIDPSMNKATIDGQELELVLPGGDVWYPAYFKPDKSVTAVLANRPPAGRPPADYRELDPAPAQSTQTAPPDSGRREPE